MKCENCGKEIALFEDFYIVDTSNYCIDCIRKMYTKDQANMLFAGLDINNAEDIEFYNDLCAKYPNREISNSKDSMLFEFDLLELNGDNCSQFESRVNDGRWDDDKEDSTFYK